MTRRYLPTIVVALVMLGLPAVFGWLLVGDYALLDRYDHFELALSEIVTLAFPLLATLVYGLFFAQELAAGAWMPMQVRRGRRGYLFHHLGRAALICFVVAATMILLVGVATLWAAPEFGWITYRPDPGVTPPAERFTFAQLLPWGDGVFVAMFAVWVGLHAALYGMLGVLALVNVGNRLLALALPFTSMFLNNFLFAVLGLERWGMLAAVLPFNMTQGPLWIPVLSTTVIGSVVAGLIFLSLSPGRSPAGYQ